jgi:hypothetical protein
VSGLYAEGRIDAESSSVLMVPESALVKSGDKTYAWKVNAAGKSLVKADLAIGARDQRTGAFEVKSGLAAGDLVLRAPNSSLKDGQAVQMAGAKPQSLASVGTPGAQGK